MTSTADASPSTVATGRVTRAVTVLAGAVAAIVVWVVAVQGLDVDLTVTQRGTTTEVGIPLVALNAIIGGLAGWVLLALLERFTRRPRRIWLIVAPTLLVVSFVTPFTVGASAGARATLLLLHLTVAAVVIPGLARTSR